MINSSDKQIIKSILSEIKTSLISLPIEKRGFLNGAGGIGLFLFNYNLLNNDPTTYDKAYQLLNYEANLFNQPDLKKSNLNDLQWLVWLVFHLQNNNIISIEKDEYNYILPIFLAQSKAFKVQGNYDLFYGQIGLGLILHEFMENQEFIDLNEQFFIDTAEKNGKSFKWFFSLFSIENQGYNFGLAHGIPSIILYLCKLFENSNYTNVNFSKLITGGTSYLLENMQDHTKVGSFFPNIITKEKKDHFSRLAWCYGDLGVGFSIWKSGIVTQNQEFINKGLEILLHSAKRKETKDTAITDLGICHGSSGLILFYKRLYEFTKLPDFRDACLYWLSYTIGEISSSGSIDKILVWDLVKQQYEFEEGLLTGVAGIGMVLSEFISKKNTSNWSEFLLL